MDIKTIQKPLKDFRNKLINDILIEEMIVFGSYLEGTAQKDSDVDVIIVSDDFKGMDAKT